MKKNHKLLFFTEYYHPVCNTTGYYMTEIIENAAKKWQGDVRIYCATSLDGKNELLSQENVKTIRFSGGKMNKNSLLTRILKFLLITLKFGAAALFKVSWGDTVFTVTNPAFMLVFLAFLRKIKRFNYVLLVYDVFPESLIPAGLTKKTSFSYKITLKIFNWAYRSVDELVVIGRDMGDLIAQKTGRKDNITMITNWVNTDEIKPAEKINNKILQKYSIEKKRVFALGGNMGRTQGLENLFAAFKLLTANDDRVFLFMGDGAGQQKIKDFIAENPDVPLIYTGRIPGDQQNDMLNACDIAMISLAPGMYGISVPSKTYFNLAAGKPLLLVADETSEVALMIKEYELGWVVPPGEPEKLAAVIEKLTDLSDAELDEYAKRARFIAENNFSHNVILTCYDKVFEKY